MSKKIQWSNHSHRANGNGRTLSNNGELIPSHYGYIDQALEISLNPTEFGRQDQDKALRVLAGTSFAGHAERIREAIATAEANN